MMKRNERKKIAQILVICIVMSCAYVGCGRQKDQVNNANIWEADIWETEHASGNIPAATQQEDKVSETKPDYDRQIELFAAHCDEWLHEDGVSDGNQRDCHRKCESFTITDLDQNGRLELVAAPNRLYMDEGYFYLYEINETMDGIQECEYFETVSDAEAAWGGDGHGIQMHYDTEEDIYYYIFTGIFTGDSLDSTGNYGGERKSARYLKDGKLYVVPIAAYERKDGNGHWYDAEHKPLRFPGEYELQEARLFDWDIDRVNFTWLTISAKTNPGDMTEEERFEALKEIYETNREENRKVYAEKKRENGVTKGYAEQLDLIAQNAGQWLEDSMESMWAGSPNYMVSDLDHDGRLEIVLADIQGSGRYSYNRFYEVNDDGDALEERYLWERWISSEADMRGVEETTVYHDEAEDVYYYVFDDVERYSSAEYACTKRALALKGAFVRTCYLAGKTDTYKNDAWEEVWYDCYDRKTDSEGYEASAGVFFAGLKETTARFGWFSIPKSETVIGQGQANEEVSTDMLRELLEDSLERSSFSINAAETYICQTDYTQITYADGYYYYQSEADHFYLYRSMEDGENPECLAEEVVKELYILDNWVYFTNLSEGSALYKVRADGGGMEAVCGEPIDRFFPIGETFFCLSEAENGASRIFSCTADGKRKEIYEGKCDWLSTDGELLYAEVQADDETQLQIIVMDKEGNVLREYPYSNCFIPTKRALYYYIMEKSGEDYIRQIVRLDQETGEEVCYKVPEGHWKGCSYIVDNDKIYVLCYSSQKYTFFQYDEESNSFLPLCPCMDIAGEHTLFDKIDNGFYLVNGKIFVKVFVEDGKGELWHYIGLEERKAELFESMEIPVDVDTSWQSVFRQNAFYREGYLDEDIVYSEDADDGQGYVMFTTITVPEISVEIPAAGIINQKIREDVEEFYKERNLFHESAKEDDIELETSYGEFNCPFAYAGEHYVSIVYEKHLSTNSGYSGGWEYVTRLYSSKTGEELQPEALFSVSPERLFLGLSFLIRKTERGFDCFSDDLFYKGGISTYYRVYYCITSEGLDIFFVEDMRTDKEFHFLISYREMEDIIR